MSRCSTSTNGHSSGDSETGGGGGGSENPGVPWMTLTTHLPPDTQRPKVTVDFFSRAGPLGVRSPRTSCGKACQGEVTI